MAGSAWRPRRWPPRRISASVVHGACAKVHTLDGKEAILRSHRQDAGRDGILRLVPELQELGAAFCA